MTELFTFLGEELIHSLGWTFVHSLWQGSLIALIMTAVLSQVPHSMARKRYAIAYSSLILMCVTAATTFALLYQAPMEVVGESSFVTQQVMIEGGSESSGLYQWISQLNPVFVSIWLLGVLFFALRIGFGLLYLRHLKQHASATTGEWQHKLDGIVRHLRYQRPVRLAQSAMLKIPVVVGTFKPIVLFPVGILNQLGPEEVEAILAHEVAHLVRNDFVHNLVQSLIEMIFYYHPAVWWISAMVRSERENCCDDLAIQVCGSSLTYAKALVNLQDMSHRTPALALPIASSKGHLLNRIKRILNQPQNKSNVMEKVIATIMLVGCVTLLSFSYKNQDLPDPSLQEIDIIEIDHSIYNDTVPAPVDREVTVWRNDNGREIEMRKENGVITHLEVDGREIDPAEYGAYEPEIEAMEEIEVPQAPPVPPVPPVPSVAPAPPTPPVPPKAPEADGYGFWFSQDDNADVEKRSSTTTIIREKKGNGYTYRVESDGAGAEVIVKGDKGIAIVDGQEIQLDADSVFIIQKEEVSRAGAPNARFWGSNGKDFEVRGISPNHSGSYVLRLDDANISEDMKRKLEEYKVKLEEYNLDLKGFDNDLEFFARDQEQYAKDIEQFSRNWNAEHADEIKRYTEDLQRHIELENAQGLRSGVQLQRLNEFKLQDDLGGEFELAIPERSISVAPNNEFHVLRADGPSVFFRQQKEPFSAITSAMVRDGIIDRDDEYNIVMDEDKLKVNGKRMPHEVHEKYMEIFRKSQGYEVSGKTKIEISNKS